MAVTFPSMYDYNDETGMTIPITSDIKTYVENAMKDIFGSDIDLTPETPAGRMVEALTLMFKNVVGVNAQNLNQLNIQYASGQYLESLAQFFGLERLPATKTQINFTAYGSTSTATLPQGTVLIDKNGHTYVTQSTITTSQPNTISLPEVPDANYFKEGNAIATEEGPFVPVGNNRYNNAADQIYPSSSYELSFSGGTDIVYISSSPEQRCVVGRYAETDAELRTRISTARSFGSGCTQAIANAIWKACPDLRSVRVLENPTGSQTTVMGIKLAPHSILVCVSATSDILYCEAEQSGGDYYVTKQSDATQAIAEAIFATKAAGINITDLAHLPSNPLIANILENTDLNVDIHPGTDWDYCHYNPSKDNPDYDDDEETFRTWYSKHYCEVEDKSSGIKYPVVFYGSASQYVIIEVTLKINGYAGVDIVQDVKNTINQYVYSKMDTLTTTELMMIVSQAISGVFVTNLTMFDNNTQTYITSVTPNGLTSIVPGVFVTVQNM